MRIRIIFNLLNGESFLPFYHQQEILASLSYIFKKYGLEFNLSDKFTFSSLKGGFKVTAHGLQFQSPKVSLVLSGFNSDLVNKAKELIFEEKQFTVGELMLIPEFFQVEDKPNFDLEMKYICLSPFALISPISNGGYSDKFIHPLDNTFSDFLYYSSIERMEATGLYSEQEIESFAKFQLVPEKGYLDKFEGQEIKFARIYSAIFKERSVRIRGYVFPFTLYAHPKVQEFLYFNGLGECTEIGLGALDIIKETKEMIAPDFSNSAFKKRENVLD